MSAIDQLILLILRKRNQKGKALKATRLAIIEQIKETEDIELLDFIYKLLKAD